VLAADTSVSATFAAIQPAQVNVTVSGSGTITSSPAGINCPGTCTASFSDGTSVTLSSSAAAGYSFSGFSGACSGSACQLSVTGGQTYNIDGDFAPIPPPQDITAINHIIVLLQENRSFDHYFGQLATYWQANGYPQATNGTTFDGEPANSTNIDPNGDPVTPFNLQTGCTENPSPSWNESHSDRNRFNPADSTTAPMDGFVHTAAKDAAGYNFYDVLGHRAMGYFDGKQLNYYYFMASNFATSDRWFAPVLTRTQPNRMYLYAATSQGHVNALNTTNSPPLTAQTIFQSMQNNGVTWIRAAARPRRVCTRTAI
jgi:phospholipase C